jgi:hypothetical protein
LIGRPPSYHLGQVVELGEFHQFGRQRIMGQRNDQPLKPLEFRKQRAQRLAGIRLQLAKRAHRVIQINWSISH